MLSALATTVVVTSSSSSSGAMIGFWVGLLFWILMIVAVWRIFVKAGEAGWKSIIPFYSSYILFKIAGRNGLWFLALFVPFVNIFVLLMLAIDLAKHFGKSTLFGVVALWIFSVIGFLILGYGDAEYVGPAHE
jgi:hypothetical protein